MTLVSAEKHEFQVEKQAAMVSNTIKGMLAGPGPENRVEFPELGDKVLEEVFGRPPPPRPPPPAAPAGPPLPPARRSHRPAALIRFSGDPLPHEGTVGRVR